MLRNPISIRIPSAQSSFSGRTSSVSFRSQFSNTSVVSAFNQRLPRNSAQFCSPRQKQASVKPIKLQVDGKIKKWLKNEGDYVKENEPVVTVMRSDMKEHYTFNSPESGVITDILMEENQDVGASTTIYSLDICGYISQARPVCQHKTETASMGPSS